MLEDGSPPEHEERKACSVSPLSSHNASRSSTPGVSSLDGTPRYLFAFSPPPLPHSATPQDMAMKPAHHPDHGRREHQIRVKALTLNSSKAQEAPTVPVQDTTNPPMVDDSSTPVPSLNDIAHLLRLEKYHSRNCGQAQLQLHRAHHVAARTFRLLHTARSVQRTLAECIKAEDKHSFVNLFSAFHDAISASSDTSNALPESDQTEAGHAVLYPASFVDSLPNGPRTAVLDFLHKVKHDADFVADRLATLTHRELISLLPDKGQPKSTESVFGSSPRTSLRSSKHLGFIADGQTDLLSSSELGSPLDTLVQSVRSIADVSLHKDGIATDLWATVCARLITEQKPGSEKFVSAVIDSWAASAPWPGRERLGTWVSNTLQKGFFLLERTNKPSFRVRMQGHAELSFEDEARSEAFFTAGVTSLFGLLSDPNGASVVPQGALRFCEAICEKLNCSPNHRQAFPNFVLTRWLFASFVPDAITLPEIHGELTDYYIPDSARQRILREIASRCQKSVFDVVYSWRHGSTSSVEVTQLVRSVADRFQLPQVAQMDPESYRYIEDNVLATSASDIRTMVNALYPQGRHNSLFSERESSQSGLQSSASSMSGFSLFQAPAASLPSYEAPTWNRDAPLPTSLQLSAQPDAGNVSSIEPGSLSAPDAEQLREACSISEDYSAGRNGRSSNDWCILFERQASGRLSTMQDALRECVNVDLTSDRGHAYSGDGVKDYKTTKATIEELLLDQELIHRYKANRTPGERHDVTGLCNFLLSGIQNRVNAFEEDSNFVAAYSWFRKLACFQALTAETAGPSSLMPVLDRIVQTKQQSLERALRIESTCETRLSAVRPYLESCEKKLCKLVESAGRLRDKMWYVAEVRTSAAYDEARSVVSALKVMGKSKERPRTRTAQSSKHWTAPKVSATGLHLKTEAQVLEILGTPLGHGGPNKLSDEQSRSVTNWLERHSIENLCRGEERLHRLCMEIEKAADQLTAESATTWSSSLYTRDCNSSSRQLKVSSADPFWSLRATSGRFDSLTLQTNVTPSIDSVSSASTHPLSAKSSRDYLESRSPALTSQSSAPFWSPAMTEARSPSSATSMGSSQTHAAHNMPSQQPRRVLNMNDKPAKEQLQQRAISLLLSDLAGPLFSDGCETDRAFWTGLGGDLTEKHLRSVQLSATVGSPESYPGSFDFERAFQRLAQLLSASCSPLAKLDYLLHIDTLLAPYMADRISNILSSRPGLRRGNMSIQRSHHQDGPSKTVETKVEGFRRLFSNSALRPSAVFRDLQYIAAFVPSTTLEQTPQGKAFWNAIVAVAGLKQEALQIMVETADSIIAYQSNNRGTGRTSSAAQQQRDAATFTAPSRTPSAEDVARYSMADAGYLLQITAREGDAVAQRELATLYLTHPELMDHVIAPFSRPRDVFREEIESKWKKNQDTSRCDPATMCVAHHWMNLSSRGGDALAKEYLRQREEMDRLG